MAQSRDSSGRFAKSNAIEQALVDGFSRVAIQVALEVTHELVVNTPVATGWASANWVPSIGSPYVGTVGAAPTAEERLLQAERRRGAGAGALSSAGDAAREAGSAALLGYKITMGSLWVSNNVPYISGPGSLDDGHSKQQPAGWIRRAIEDGSNAVAAQWAGKVEAL